MYPIHVGDNHDCICKLVLTVESLEAVFDQGKIVSDIVHNSSKALHTAMNKL